MDRVKSANDEYLVRCTVCPVMARVEDMEMVDPVMGYICSRDCYLKAKTRHARGRATLDKSLRNY